ARLGLQQWRARAARGVLPARQSDLRMPGRQGRLADQARVRRRRRAAQRRQSAAVLRAGLRQARARRLSRRRDQPNLSFLRLPKRMSRSSRARRAARSEEHTSELQSRENLVCRLLLEKKKKKNNASRIARSHPAPTE